MYSLLTHFVEYIVFVHFMLLLQMYTRKEFVERNSCDVYMYVLLHPFYTPFTTLLHPLYKKLYVCFVYT